MLYSSKYIYNVEFSFVKVCINFFLVATVYIYIFIYTHTYTHTHSVSGGIVNILGGGSMDYSE